MQISGRRLDGVMPEIPTQIGQICKGVSPVIPLHYVSCLSLWVCKCMAWFPVNLPRLCQISQLTQWYIVSKPNSCNDSSFFSSFESCLSPALDLPQSALPLSVFTPCLDDIPACTSLPSSVISSHCSICQVPPLCFQPFSTPLVWTLSLTSNCIQQSPNLQYSVPCCLNLCLQTV